MNAKTSIYHVEDDCTYTLLKVTTQPKNNKSNIDYERMFLIQLSDTETISIPLFLNLTFIFPGTLLTHRQHCNASCYSDGSVFFNLIAYGNKRLFNHIKKSFERNIDDKNKVK